MQFMIDTSNELPAALRLAAQFLIDCASIKEYSEGSNVPPVPVVPAPPVAVPTGTSESAAPFVPPVPSAPSIADSPAPAPLGNAAATSPTVPNVPLSPSEETAPPASSGPASATDEYDSAGVPWDARIHQSGRAQKKDGTWKIKKNLDDSIVTEVIRDLFARGRVRAIAAKPAEVPAAGSFSGTVPVPPVASVPAADGLPAQSGGHVPVPPAPADGGVPVPPPPVSLPGPAAAAVPVPPAPVVGVPNASQSAVVQTGYRELIAKITKARNEGKITGEQVTQMVLSTGAPNIMALASMAHLVPIMDSHVDALLASV